MESCSFAVGAAECYKETFKGNESFLSGCKELPEREPFNRLGWRSSTHSYIGLKWLGVSVSS